MEHTFTTLMRRLSRAGFRQEFVRPAILPDWWDESCTDDPELLPEVEIRVARFLGRPLSAVKHPATPLAPPAYPEAQLRRVRDVDRDRLAPAIYAALRIGAAVVRSLRPPAAGPAIPPPEGLSWREQIRRPHPAVDLPVLVDDLWLRDIPVVPIDVLPTPSFQGMACIVEGRPVILLGHRYDEPGRVAFLVAHEVGHIAAGDCAPEQPVVDEEEEIRDDTDMERKADLFATHVLVGGDSAPPVEGASFKEIASRASEIERSTGADASAVIFAWAASTGDYAKASMAVKALYRASGARRLLREHFDRHVDLQAAPESDRALLRCVYGDPEHDAAAA